MGKKLSFPVVLRAVKDLLSPELINDVTLPDDLLDARTEEEIKERYYYLYHEIFTPMGLKVARKLKRQHLTVDEIRVISKRVEAYLKDCGF